MKTEKPIFYGFVKHENRETNFLWLRKKIVTVSDVFSFSYFSIEKSENLKELFIFYGEPTHVGNWTTQCKRAKTKDGVTSYPRTLIQVEDGSFLVLRGGPTSERATRDGMGWNYSEVDGAREHGDDEFYAG